jgi:hypothetical protein
MKSFLFELYMLADSTPYSSILLCRRSKYSLYFAVESAFWRIQSITVVHLDIRWPWLQCTKARNPSIANVTMAYIRGKISDHVLCR